MAPLTMQTFVMCLAALVLTPRQTAVVLVGYTVLGAIGLPVFAGGVVVNHYAELSDTVKLCAMYDTLLAAVKIAEEYRIRMNLEALNIKLDHVGNFLRTTQMAAEITRLIGSPWLKVLFDAYHMQYNEGALSYQIETYFDQIGHIHIADCPGRHEPGTGEINYSSIYRLLERLGYEYRVGYELFPAVDTKTAVTAIMKN